MLDLKLHIPVTDEVEVSSETLSAIDRGISDADEGSHSPHRGSPKTNSRVDFQIRIAKAKLARYSSKAIGSWFARNTTFAQLVSMTAEQRALLNDLLWVDTERLSGAPCFKGTRVPVQALIDHIEGNSTLEDFLAGFPSVSRAPAIQFIELAKGNLLLD
jgi:uncharacterized protein (DUF433 family)